MGITLPKMKHFRLNDQTIQTICPVSKKLSKIQQIVKNATDNQQMWQIAQNATNSPNCENGQKCLR